MKYGEKYYRSLSDYTLQELTFKHMEGKSAVFHDQYNTEVKLSGQSLSGISLSKIVVLTEMQEELQNKISIVHDMMRELKVKFNPTDTPSIIYRKGSIREIHQYDKTTGKYIRSFSSVSEAVLSVGGNPKQSHIQMSIRGDRQTSYKGYKWRYEKYDKIKP